MKGKKGLATGILALTLVMFIMAFSSLVSLAMWNQVNGAIQNMDNQTVSPEVKQQVDDLTRYLNWGDKLFIAFFVILLASYLISSATIPTDRPVFMILFLFILIFTTVIAMILSNAWAYLVQDPNFIVAAESHKFTDYFMRYYPFIVFFTGLTGAIIFYGRRASGITSKPDGGVE